MNISSVGSSSYLSSIKSVQGQNDGDADDRSVGQSSGAAASVKLSKPAELMSKLSQLESSDPAQFKTVMNDIAQKLGSSSDPGAKALAAKFTEAAKTGDLSALQPKGPPGGPGGPGGAGGAQHAHHGHHAHGGGMRAAMQSALDEVNQALTSSTSSSSASSSASTTSATTTA